MRTRRQDKAGESAAENNDAPPTTVLWNDDGQAQDNWASTAAAAASKLEDFEEEERARLGRAIGKSRSKLPTPIQFPLVAILSLAISELGYQLSWSRTQGVIAAHARLPGTWPEIAALMGWRLFELALGWFGNYDGYDITALNILSQGPTLYLLYAHYNTAPVSLGLAIAIDTLATYIPFRLLRPLSRAHANPATVPNADILTDVPIALLTTLLAGAIYSVTLVLAYATYLPTSLIVYFEGLPSLVRAHDSSYVGLLPVTLVLGFATRVFIFTPAEATGRTAADVKNEAFNPAKASLRETVRWNFLGWSSQTKVALRRTALLVMVTGVNTFLRISLTIVGAEAPGAAAWSGVWAFAGAISGIALCAVGGV